VRTEAVRLRGRLGEYYLNGGRTDPLIIELPKGGYAPVFRRHDVGSEILQTEVKLARKPRRVPLRLAIALASQVAIAAAAVFWRLYRQTTPIPIAVLPLENVGHDPEGDFFSDGLTSEIIRDLSIIRHHSRRSAGESASEESRIARVAW